MSAEEKTYLELSEAGEGSHKFYEVTVKDKALTIRFGRIGDAGQSTTKKFATADAARAEAAKKIAEKKRKGYEEAVKCLVGDEDWLYAGCDDGNVYDLTGKVPRLAYTISEKVNIYWLDICGG